MTGPPTWDERYDVEHFLFGEEPNAFLRASADQLRPGWRALALGDGEGRNGTWLAAQGLDVLAVDISAKAQEKARALAKRRGVELQIERADLTAWSWPTAAFDVVVAIFIQFGGADTRARIFEGIARALKPGGLLLLEGYRPEQLNYGTGGPPFLENMYTEVGLREAFSGWEIVRLSAYDATIEEGTAHRGRSALIDLIARKPA